MYKIFKYLIIISTCFIANSNLYAQSDSPLVRWTPEGMVVFIAETVFSDEYPDNGKVAAIVYRKSGDETEFTEVAKVQMPSSWIEFTNRGGADLAEQLALDFEMENVADLWAQVSEMRNLEHWGFYAIIPDLWRAMGFAFFDEHTLELNTGTVIEYEVRYLMDDDSLSEVIHSGSSLVGWKPSISPPVSVKQLERDDMIGGTWVADAEASPDVAFARVFLQEGIHNEYTQLDELIMAQRTDSLIIYNWEFPAEPERAYRAFIEPLDLFGNSGPRSDTLMVISVDFDNIPLMGRVTSQPNASGIHLSWNPLPNKPYLVGIEVSRSRDARHSYVVLDTLAVTSTGFTDTRIVPNLTYYYQFRVVTVRNDLDLPSSVASAVFENVSQPPMVPSGLQAIHEGEQIRLTWNPVEEADLFAYYVYRSTSAEDSMEVISRAITGETTFLDDSEILDGRTNYVYGVKALNHNMLESHMSNMVVIRPHREVLPAAPVGISGYGEQNRIVLSWRDVSRRDGAVTGYHLYRSDSQIAEPVSGTHPDEITGLLRLTKEPLRSTGYVDIDVRPGESYTYALTSVDLFGVESSLSSFAVFSTSIPALTAPGQVTARYINGRAELQWNRTHQENVTGYYVYRRLRGQDEAVRLGRIGSDDTTFTDTQITSGVLYWYSVSVIAGDRESPRSAEQAVHIR